MISEARRLGRAHGSGSATNTGPVDPASLGVAATVGAVPLAHASPRFSNCPRGSGVVTSGPTIRRPRNQVPRTTPDSGRP